MMKTAKSILAVALVLGATTTFLGTAGCAGGPFRRSTGEYVDDGSITAKVKTELLRDQTVSGFDVGVDTFKGTVQLNGWVDTPEQKTRAEQIARGVPGVVNVANKLTVRTTANP